MTSKEPVASKDTKQQARRLDDERYVDELLAESDVAADAGLRQMLLRLREFRVTEVPPPSAEVAALMGWPGASDGSPASVNPSAVVSLEDWSRRSRKKRVAFTTLAVAASLGIAGGAAAGNDTLRRGAEGTISTIVRSFSPPAPASPAPAVPSGAPGPTPAVVPSPAVTAPPVVTVPAVPAPAPAPDSAPAPAKEPPAGKGQDPAGAPRVPGWASPADGGTVAPAEIPQSGKEPAVPPASRPAAVPPWAGQPSAGVTEAGKAGKAAVNGQGAPNPADQAAGAGKRTPAR
ncbi:hypothetical protein [Arthrobacter sp. P2b]|uniref:hypothetical protein n=1 Tax=Arthrobacter sp. P2b TaxID=1938741 RepID=UPI001117589A|nr:hypothetical protein [Arthrobacter sp. P2b]